MARWLFLIVLVFLLGACAKKAEQTAAPEKAAPAEQEIPSFALPAPRPSARTNLPRNLFGHPTTIGDVESAIRTALKTRGYPDARYYAVPGGFAMVTAIERIKADGTPFPIPGRWQLAATPLLGSFSFAGLLDRLRNADPGHYRVLVFLVTTNAVTSGGANGTFEEASGWVGGGGDFLPAAIAGAPLTGQHNISLLIYEFARPAVNVDPRQVFGLTANDHMRAAHLLR